MKFDASRGRFQRCKARASLHNVALKGEAAGADLVVANLFQMFQVTNDYSLQQIMNVDETGLCWKKIPSRTFISREEKSVLPCKKTV